MSGYARVPQSELPDDDEAHPPAPAAAPSAAGAPAPAPVPSAANPRDSPAPAAAASLARFRDFIFSFLAPAVDPPPPHIAARRFAMGLRAVYGASVPPLLEGSYEEALRAGAARSVPVLLYLQSDLHADTGEFLARTLCTPSVCGAISHSGIVAWGGRVHDANGLEASLRLDAAGYPFVGIYALAEGSGSGGGASPKYRRLWAHEGGLITPEDLAAAIASVGAAVAVVSTRAAVARAAADGERQLRRDQDRAYEQGLLADAARERAAAEARMAAAAAAAEAEEKAELASAVQLSLALEDEGILTRARARIAASPEPPPDTPSRDVAALRINLPGGVKLQRTFTRSAPISLVADYVAVASADLGAPLALGKFDLATAHPRVTYDTHSSHAAGGAAGGVASADRTTLGEAGLAGSVVLVTMVE